MLEVKILEELKLNLEIIELIKKNLSFLISLSISNLYG